MSKKTVGSAFDRLDEYIKSKTAKMAEKISMPTPGRKPALLPDGTTGEQYTFIKYDMSYDPTYDDGSNNEQQRLKKLLDEFVLNYKPRSYRIINAQVVFMGSTGNGFNDMPPGIQHVVHIAYLK